MPLIHLIGHDLSRQNKFMSDESLKKRNISQPSDNIFEILNYSKAYWKQYTNYTLGAYLTPSMFQAGVCRKGIANIDELFIFLSSSFTTYGHLLDQASCRQSDKFQAVVQRS